MLVDVIAGIPISVQTRFQSYFCAMLLFHRYLHLIAWCNSVCSVLFCDFPIINIMIVIAVVVVIQVF